MYRDLPSRGSVRLPGFDYTSSNLYYVTICSKERKCLFGDVINPGGARRGSPVTSMMFHFDPVDIRVVFGA